VFDKNFEIPLMDIECELLEIPDVDYDAEWFSLRRSQTRCLN
jgi:hypothetical protein